MPRKISLDIDALTLGDLELFEDACGGDLMTALTPEVVRDPKTGKPVPDPDDPKHRPLMAVKMTAKTMLGLVYVSLKREDPDMTVAQVRAMPLNELDFSLEGFSDGDSEPDPTEQPEPEGEQSD